MVAVAARKSFSSRPVVRESQVVARTEPETPEGVIARLRQITELTENAALKARAG
jgi:hypothetical protein